MTNMSMYLSVGANFTHFSSKETEPRLVVIQTIDQLGRTRTNTVSGLALYSVRAHMPLECDNPPIMTCSKFFIVIKHSVQPAWEDDT